MSILRVVAAAVLAGLAVAARAGMVAAPLGVTELVYAAPHAQAVLAARAAPAVDDAYVKKAMDEWGVPGLSLAVIKDNQVVVARGYGVREVGRPAVVDEQTLFAIGSTTKAYTSASMAMLVDEGKVKWNDPVTKYLPKFQLYDPWVTREFTVRDSLAHRSGLGRRGDLIWYGSGLSRDEVLDRIRFLKPNTSFRSAYGYQNIMYLAAGQVVAAASRMTWDDFIRQRIFRPLGMSRSNTSTKDLAGAENVAQPHEQREGHLSVVPYANADNIGPAGSINSSAREMAEWVRFQLGDGTIDGRKLVSAAILRETRLPQTIIPTGEGNPLKPHFVAYCMGWVAQDYRGKMLLWHNGGIDGMKAMVALVPEEQLGVVVLANRGGTQLTEAMGYRLVDTWMGPPVHDWSQELLADRTKSLEEAVRAEAKVTQARATGTHPTLGLDRYAAVYSSELYGEQRITLENGHLVWHGHSLFNGPLEHWHYDTFRTTGPQREFVTFQVGADAQVSGMTVESMGDFRRKADAK